MNGGSASASRDKCPFFVNVYGKNGEWKVTKMQLSHNHAKFIGYQQSPFAESGRDGTDKPLRDRDTNYKLLQTMVERELFPGHAGSEKNITAKAIIAFLCSKNYAVDKQTAGRIKHKVLAKREMDVVESYQKLEVYLKSVAAANPGSHWAFEKATDGKFFRACFFPSPGLQAFPSFMQLVGLDGTHLKGEMNKRGVILTATTKDYDHHTLVFGFAIVPVENYDHWEWFLRQVAIATDTTNDNFIALFISDRQKGLLAAVEAVFPSSGHRFCLRHIVENIARQTQRLAPVEEGFVYEVPRADCKNDWQFAFEQLEAARPAAAEYVKTIPKKHWVKYAIHENYCRPSYDEVTSNLSESANNWIGNECRSADPVQAFNVYFMKLADQLHDRRQRAHSMLQQEVPAPASSEVLAAEPLLPRWRVQLEALAKQQGNCSLTPCLDGMYMVRYQGQTTSIRGNNHPWRAVNLVEKNCTCKNWHDLQFPCVHAIQAAIREHVDINSLFDYQKFTIAAFAATYKFPFLPIPPESNLRVDSDLHVPAVVLSSIRMGKRGRRPGPVPKDKRKSAKPGSLSNPTIATM